MTSIYTYPVLLIIVVAYFLWRRHVAVNAYIAVSSEIDDYLGENHPEELKDLVYHGLEHCLKNSVPLVAIFIYITTMYSKKETSIERLFKKHGKVETKKAIKLLFKTIIVNMQLSPVLYLIYFSIILLSLFMKVVFTIAINPKILFRNTKSKCESSIVTAVG